MRTQVDMESQNAMEIVESLHPYDFIMLAVLLLTTIFGAWKGFAWQVASLVSLVASYLVALRFSAQAAPYFGSHAPWNRFAAMLALYLATSLIVWLAFRVVAGLIDRVRLKEFDRQLGALAGAAKGILLCVAITFFVVSLSVSGRQAVLKSRSGYYIALLIDRAPAVMPEEIHEILEPYLDRLDQRLRDDQPPVEPRTALEAGLDAL